MIMKDEEDNIIPNNKTRITERVKATQSPTMTSAMTVNNEKPLKR